MPIEHPTDATVIDGIAIAVPDNPREFAIGEGMGDRQLHDVLLDVTRQELFNGGPTPGVGQITAIDQSQEPIAFKAAQVTSQPPIIEACLAAVLRKRTLLLQDRTNLFIAREGLLIGWRVSREEVQLEGADLILWHAFLLPSQQRFSSSNRGGIYA
jgi:hypothetical protein